MWARPRGGPEDKQTSVTLLHGLGIKTEISADVDGRELFFPMGTGSEQRARVRNEKIWFYKHCKDVVAGMRLSLHVDPNFFARFPPTPLPQCRVAWSTSRCLMLRADRRTFGLVVSKSGLQDQSAARSTGWHRTTTPRRTSTGSTTLRVHSAPTPSPHSGRISSWPRASAALCGRRGSAPRTNKNKPKRPHTACRLQWIQPERVKPDTGEDGPRCTQTFCSLLVHSE